MVNSFRAFPSLPPRSPQPETPSEEPPPLTVNPDDAPDALDDADIFDGDLVPIPGFESDSALNDFAEFDLGGTIDRRV